MKFFKLIAAALFCAAAFVSCEKQEQFVPATISGKWVFSATDSGSGWNSLDVKRLYVFDGKGGYVVKDIQTGSANFADGKLNVPESAFVQGDSKVYAISCAAEKYRFETLQGDYILIDSSASEMSFEHMAGSENKGYKFSKVVSFQEETPVDPEPPIDPDHPAINGSALAEGNDLVGLVSNATTGKGIPGVTVSDGYDCVATDANGVYQFKSNALTRIVYISTPSEYKIPVGTTPSQPVFYAAVAPKGERIRTDFKLTPMEGGAETNWTFIGIGDPQCATASNATRYTTETISDIKTTTSGQKSVYAMTLGDIVFDSTDMWPTMKSTMSSVSNGSWNIIFFQTIGNHDHDSLKPDTNDDAADDYNATSTFVSQFGPTDYSFNRGDVHVVSMDDIKVMGQSSSSRSNGRTWSYDKGFTDAQFEWLKKDIALVPDKSKKMVFVCCHIPWRNAANSKFSHCQDVLKLLADFKEVHIMIGHTHYTQNVVYSTYLGRGGLPFYEHVHGSACGAWWTSSCSSTVTGEPSGYTIYKIEGAHIKDWQFKGTKRDINTQLRVFDGNALYYQSNSYPLNWYTASQKAGSGSITVKGNANLQYCFVAELFNDDDKFWTVDLVKKSTGAKIGSFKRLADGYSTNVAMSAYYFNKKNKNSTSYSSTTASHYWYYKPASGQPADETDWEVVVTHKLPDGQVTHTYTCSKITNEADFAKEFYF